MLTLSCKEYIENKKSSTVWRRKKERTSRCALDLKDFCIFIEGAGDRFLLSDFPVFGKKQIYMDGEQMGELALII